RVTTPDLPPLHRPPSRPASGRKVLVLLALLSLGVVGVLLVGGAETSRSLSSLTSHVSALFGSAKPEILTDTVRRVTLPVTVTAKGSLESSKNEDVFCEVEGQTTIIRILP